jgi:hypothetical protein
VRQTLCCSGRKVAVIVHCVCVQQWYISVINIMISVYIIQHNLLYSFNNCLLCSMLHVSANPHGHFQASAWRGVLQYCTIVLQLHYVPYEISYCVHHSCMVVKCKFYSPAYRWGYVRYCSCSPVLLPVPSVWCRSIFCSICRLCVVLLQRFWLPLFVLSRIAGCALVLCCLIFVSGLPVKDMSLWLQQFVLYIPRLTL